MFKNSLFLACIILQILDGVFTGYAATHSSLGLSVEGNPLVKQLMLLLGVFPALFLLKSLAIVFLVFLKKLKTSIVVPLIIFGFYSPVVATWAYILFLDKLP